MVRLVEYGAVFVVFIVGGVAEGEVVIVGDYEGGGFKGRFVLLAALFGARGGI